MKPEKTKNLFFSLNDITMKQRRKKKMECLDQILILIVQWWNAIWMDEDVTEIQKDKRSALQPFYLYGHPVKKKTA